MFVVFLIKPFVDVSTFALKSKHVRFLQFHSLTEMPRDRKVPWVKRLRPRSRVPEIFSFGSPPISYLVVMGHEQEKVENPWPGFFFKVSLRWPQGNFKRPLGGIWETVLHWYDLRSLYFERPLEEFERPFWSHTLKKTLPLTICRLRYVTVCRTIRIVPALEGAHRRFAEDAGIAVLQAAWEAEGDWRELSICMPNQ